MFVLSLCLCLLFATRTVCSATETSYNSNINTTICISARHSKRNWNTVGPNLQSKKYRWLEKNTADIRIIRTIT